MNRSLVKWLVGVIAVALIAIAGVRAIQHKKAAEAAVPPAKSYGIVVPVEPAKAGPVELTIPFLAQVESDSDVQIGSKVTARVKMIVPAGSRVEAGQVLARLDAGDLEARKHSLELKIRQVGSEIEAKQADLRSLQKTHERNRKLLDVQAISRDRFETEASRISSLRASIDALRSSQASLRASIREIDDTLSYTTVVAPMAGVVSKTFVSAGGTVGAGKPLLSLAGGSAKRLLVRVPDDISPKALVYAGQRCALQPLNSSYHGLDEYSCQLATDESAGNRVEVRLVVYSGNGVLLPRNGVLAINGKHFVLAVEDGKATPREVEVIAEGSEGLLVGGLPAGVEYALAKPDMLLKLMSGVPVIRAGG